MTPDELKIMTQIFTVLPTVAISVSIAVMYVKWQKGKTEEQNEKDKMKTDIADNRAMIIKLIKIHLARHKEDESEFLEKELV